MAENAVTTTYYADSKAAEAGLAKLEQAHEKLENKVKHLHQESKHGSEHSSHAFREMGLAAGGMALGFTSAEGALESLIDKTIEYRNEAEKAAMAGQNLKRSVQIRTGQTDEEAEATTKTIKNAAMTAGRPVAEANSLHRALMEKGKLTVEEANASIEEQQKAFAAVKIAKPETSPEDYAAAMSKSLDQGKKKKTPEDLAKAGQRVFEAIQGTDASAQDLASMAESLQTMKAGKLGKDNQGHKAALHKLGLNFKDVDQVGENQFEALNKIKAGLEKRPVEDRAPILQQLFGDAAMAKRALDALPGVDHKEGQFDVAKDRAIHSRENTATRQNLEAEFADEEKAGNFKRRQKALDAALKKADVSPFGRGAAEKISDWASGLGASDKTATWLGGMGGTNLGPMDFGKSGIGLGLEKEIDLHERAAEGDSGARNRINGGPRPLNELEGMRVGTDALFDRAEKGDPEAIKQVEALGKLNESSKENIDVLKAILDGINKMAPGGMKPRRGRDQES